MCVCFLFAKTKKKTEKNMEKKLKPVSICYVRVFTIFFAQKKTLGGCTSSIEGSLFNRVASAAIKVGLFHFELTKQTGGNDLPQKNDQNDEK